MINVGAGKKHIQGADSLDADSGWHAPTLPYPDGSITTIYALHFLEHLDKDTFLAQLKEFERVLHPGGVVIIVVPYYSAQIAHQDIDHKLFFTEGTWTNIFDNKYYNGTMPREWCFHVQTCVIMGLVERNLSLFTQLVRGPIVP
jgi:predicted SAM-dependent methyltransferase